MYCIWPSTAVCQRYALHLTVACSEHHCYKAIDYTPSPPTQLNLSLHHAILIHTHRHKCALHKGAAGGRSLCASRSPPTPRSNHPLACQLRPCMVSSAHSYTVPECNRIRSHGEGPTTTCISCIHVSHQARLATDLQPPPQLVRVLPQQHKHTHPDGS